MAQTLATTMEDRPTQTTDVGIVLRFTLFTRVLHAGLAVSVYGLILTGMPLKYPNAFWAEPLMHLWGGPRWAGFSHRAFATLLIAVGVLHLGGAAVATVRKRLPRLLGPDSMVLEYDGRRTVFRVQGLTGRAQESRDRDQSSGFLLTNGGRSYLFLRPVPAFTAPKTAPHQERGLRAPMHGTVVKVFVEPGQLVEAHQPLVALEAMKMEHTIDAQAEGTVTQLLCQIGQQVKEGDLLVEVDGK